MRIVFSNYDDIKNPYYAGGGAYAIHEVAKRLARNHEVEVITGNYPGAKNLILDKVTYRRIGLKVGPKLGQLLYHLALPFYVFKGEFDVFIESFTPPHSTSFTPLFTRRPVIGLVHMLSAEDMQRKYKIPFGLVEKLGLRIYKHFIVLTKSSKDKLLKLNPKAKINVIPIGINSSKRKVGNKKYVLFMGRIEVDQKGLDLLCLAYKKILEKTNIKLLIAGSGIKTEEEKLKKIIKELSLKRKVKFLGRVEGKRKEELLRQAYFIVIPSRYETFSMLALEACSFGIPILSFDIEGLSWLPAKVCLKVEPFNTEEFANGLLKLLSNEKLRKKMGENGFKFSRNFDWEEISKKYEKYIFKILGVVEDSNTKSFAKMLYKIISKKINCFFISPHPDDAVFSAGGLIAYLAPKTRVTVINVFTSGDKGPYTLSSRVHLILNKVFDARELYKKRREDDRKVLNKLGVRIINLGFVEALYRKTKTENFFLANLGKLIPEIISLYPTFRFHVLGGNISKKDKDLVFSIARKLKEVIADEKDTLVFCPLAYGSHVDHLIVKKAVKTSFKKVIFWEDLPYSFKKRRSIFEKKRNSFYFYPNTILKEKLISGYKNQNFKAFGKIYPFSFEIFSKKESFNF